MPGFAKTVDQKGTEPSANSIHSGFASGRSHCPACAGALSSSAPRHARMRRSPFRTTDNCLAERRTAPRERRGRSELPGSCEPSVLRLRLVERRVDLRNLRGLPRLVRAPAVVDAGLAAERQVEVAEAVAAVGADLLQRREQCLPLVVAAVERAVGRTDVDAAVPPEAGGSRDQLADDHVLLQTEQAVDLALDRGVGQHLRRLLEGGGGEERLGRQRGLGDAEDQRLVRRLLALGLADALVLALEDELVDQLAGQQLGV